MQALAERLDAALAGASVVRVDPLGFAGLKTVEPAPDALVGARLERVTRRGKYLVFDLEPRARLVVHLSQAGRLDLEMPPKTTRQRTAVVRFGFAPSGREPIADRAVLVREHGRERKAGWWVLAADDDGPLAKLGPEPGDDAFAERLGNADDTRQLHTILRDQRFVAGVGRGYADDALNLAGLSPFASLRSLGPAARAELLGAVRAVLEQGLELERRRSGGLSEPSLKTAFEVHNRSGQPCPRCGETLLRVSFEAYEVVYCKACQTKGKVLADRRLSRLLR